MLVHCLDVAPPDGVRRIMAWDRVDGYAVVLVGWGVEVLWLRATTPPERWRREPQILRAWLADRQSAVRSLRQSVGR